MKKLNFLIIIIKKKKHNFLQPIVKLQIKNIIIIK